MKIFLYKSLFIFFLLLILFKLTIGKLVSNYEKQFDEYFSKEYISKVKEKIREEAKAGISKDRILSPEDALLIRKFLNKLQNEMSEGDK